MKKKCPICGAETEGNFCPDCGFNLSEVKESELTENEAVITETETDNNETSPESLSSKEKNLDEDFNEDKLDEALDESEPENTENSEDLESVVQQSVSDESLEASQTGNGETKKGDKKKIGLIIGGAIAAVVLIAIVAIASQPKLVSISAKYYGSTSKGTIVDDSSSITVTGTYDNKSSKEVTGWTVDKTTLSPGFNNINVHYNDQSTSISVYSPLMVGGQYVASVDEIKDVLYNYNYDYVDGFCGFSKDPELKGKYNYDGSVLDLSVSFTKKSGTENVDVDGSEIPNAVIVTMMLRTDDFGASLDRIVSAGAAAYTAVDPVIKYDDAYSQIKTCLSDAVGKAEGITASDEKSLDNLNIGTGMIAAAGKVMIFFSFKTK